MVHGTFVRNNNYAWKRRTREKSIDFTTCLCLNSCSSFPVVAHQSFAVKSPLAVAPKVLVNVSTFADQTAPLCPTKDPIQSPVSPFRTCGSLSIRLISKNVYFEEVMSTAVEGKSR